MIALVKLRAVALLLSLAGCAAPGEPCLGANGCGRGFECLAARCVLEGTTPVDPATLRRHARPSALAVAGGAAPPELGAAVTLGNPAVAPSALYLDFERVWTTGTIEAAFLVLSTAQGALAGADVELLVARAQSPWSVSSFSWAEKPGIGRAEARGIARAAPELPVRIDVTELVRFFRDHPARAHGLVVYARSDTGPGVTLSTGLGDGPAPELDVYLRPGD